MRASAIAHPNIALVKYWGKRDATGNLPAVGSISVTLSALATETVVELDDSLDQDVLVLNGEETTTEHRRLAACMDALRELGGDQRHAVVTSNNDFPTGAGLASSASGYAALVTASAAAMGMDIGDARLLDIARIGSGSAPRSMFGGIVVLRSEERGTTCEQIAAPNDWPLSVVVCIISDEQKSVSSRVGMERSRMTSDYYDSWVATHGDDMQAALQLILKKEFGGLAEVAECSCLKMHSVMMTSRPSLIYWLPETLACIRRIVELREEGVPVFFTVDAGPQVKAVCLPEATDAVVSELRKIAGVRQILTSELGEGARLTQK